MAALLILAHLRRHALLAHASTCLNREIDRRRTPEVRRGSGQRPRLTAAWHADAAGRLVCAWHIDTSAPDIPSG